MGKKVKNTSGAVVIQKKKALVPRELVLGLIVICISICFCLLVVEIGVRLFMPQHIDIVEYDDKVLHKYVPGKSTLHLKSENDGGEKIWVNINDDGFRGEELDDPKTKKRVMVYGDSFIASVYSNNEDTFPSQLNSLLGEEYEVINAGVEAYGPDQVSIRMEAELDLYQPDLVILGMFIGNDFSDMATGQIFRFEDGGIVKNDYAVPTKLKLRKKFIHLMPSALIYIHGINNIRSALTKKKEAQGPKKDLVGEIIKNHAKDCERSMKPGFKLIDTMFRDEPDVEIALGLDTECVQYKTELMRGVLNRIKQQTSDRDIPLVAMLIPSREDVDAGYQLKMVDPELYPEYDPARQTTHASAVLTDVGIPHLALHSHFTEKNINNTFYWPVDFHWNNDGQQFAAKLMHEFLKTENMLEKNEVELS